MKKIKIGAFLAAVLCGGLQAQNAALPEPTTGSLSNYINTAVSAATGVPDIGIPIYRLESRSKDLPVNISLSYHVYNAKPNIPASEVGQGWSLFTSGVITRQAAGDIDETKPWTEINEEQADVFYYTIPGSSGKFKIYRDPVSGNPVLNNMTGEKIKIDFVKDASSTKFIINSFKITDDNGFQYFFNEYNIGLVKAVASVNYKTSFVLTQVRDPNDNEIVNYTYDKKIKYSGTSAFLKKYQYCKINTISTAKGKLKFDYGYEGARDGEVLEDDPYTLNSITLTDAADHLLSRYRFVYSGAAFLADETSQNNEMVGIIKPRKALSAVQKLDKNLVTDEETLFEYDDEGSGTKYGYYDDLRYGNYLCSESQTLSPKKYTMGLLKKITFPTKGSVVYDFEANTVYLDKSSGNFFHDWQTQYYEMTSETPFDTNASNNYPLTVSGTADAYFEVGISDLYFNTDPHGNSIPFTYEMRNSGNQLLTPVSCGSNTLYKVFAGTYKLVTSGGAKGVIRQYTLKTMPAPYKNEEVAKAGVRVKMIRSFDADGTLVKTKTYGYDAFADPMNSSGEDYYNENYINSGSPYDGFVLYKNVKETEISGTQNNGYIRYYFKTPNDYLLAGNSYYRYYNFTSAGIIQKKEIYNSQDQLTDSAEYEYTFQEIPGASPVNLSSGTTRPSWMQYVKETETSFSGGGLFRTVKESTFSPDNFQEILTKSTAPDGETSEAVTRYAQEMGNTRFLNKNMISVPLEVETKANGSVMSKATTLYNSNSHLYPTSLESTDLNQTAETKLYFDLYDDKGNLVQTTDKSGQSVTTLWGYHKTLPIAQITGAKYSDIASVPAVSAAIAASDADADDPSLESALLAALENLRLAPQLQGYPVSARTFDPLVGITHTISPNGIRQSYEYDASGKLARVKNSEGKVLTENQYNYKH